MGYYTQFELECSKPELIAELVAEDGPLEYLFEEDGSGTGEGIKWYDHEVDMRKVSAENPGVLFTLSGEGESGTDLWREYYLNGKMQAAPARIEYDDFDSKKLK